MSKKPIDVAVIGGGMITNDQILPSLYHLQRLGVVGEISVCARHNAPLRKLHESTEFAEAFPGHTFTPYPSFDIAQDEYFPELYKDVIAKLAPRQCVIIATPDQFHYDGLMAALGGEQHILCVKPLVLTYADAIKVKNEAWSRGLFVGVEYHKRFDRRALLAKKEYGRGRFGEFIMAEGKLLEPYLYRHSNFQNWFTCDETDPFVYIGCHYVDQIYFITGLRPTSVSVAGVRRAFPNGKEGYMWSGGRVTFENGGMLSVINGLGYPDSGAGSNDQGIIMYFEHDDQTTMIAHNDQFRGVSHSYNTDAGPGGSRFNFVNPDYFKLVSWNGDGYRPVGYGYDSVAENLIAIQELEADTDGLEGRQARIEEINERGIIATPANSYINELVTEAARLSILSDGIPADIHYGESPSVKLRTS